MGEDLSMPSLGKRELGNMAAILKYWKCKGIECFCLLLEGEVWPKTRVYREADFCSLT